MTTVVAHHRHGRPVVTVRWQTPAKPWAEAREVSIVFAVQRTGPDDVLGRFVADAGDGLGDWTDLTRAGVATTRPMGPGTFGDAWVILNDDVAAVALAAAGIDPCDCGKGEYCPQWGAAVRPARRSDA